MTQPSSEHVRERILDDIVSSLKLINASYVSEPLFFNSIVHVDRVRNLQPSEFPYVYVEDRGDLLHESAATAQNITEGTLLFGIHFFVAERDQNTQTATGRTTVNRVVHDIEKVLLQDLGVGLTRSRNGNAVDTKITGFTPILSDAGAPLLGGIVTGECLYRYQSILPTQVT